MAQSFHSVFLLSSYATTLDLWLSLKAQCKTHLLCEAFLDIPAGFSRLPCSLSSPGPLLALFHAFNTCSLPLPNPAAWLVLIHPLLSPGWPPPGSTSCAQWSSDCGRRQTSAGLPEPCVTYYGTLDHVCNLSRPQLPCLKIRNKDSACAESCKDKIRSKQNERK